MHWRIRANNRRALSRRFRRRHKKEKQCAKRRLFVCLSVFGVSSFGKKRHLEKTQLRHARFEPGKRSILKSSRTDEHHLSGVRQKKKNIRGISSRRVECPRNEVAVCKELNNKYPKMSCWPRVMERKNDFFSDFSNQFRISSKCGLCAAF